MCAHTRGYDRDLQFVAWRHDLTRQCFSGSKETTPLGDIPTGDITTGTRITKLDTMKQIYPLVI